MEELQTPSHFKNSVIVMLVLSSVMGIFSTWTEDNVFSDNQSLSAETASAK